MITLVRSRFYLQLRCVEKIPVQLQVKFLKSGKTVFGVSLYGNIFCGNSFLRFGQKSAKTAKMNSCEIFFLYGILKSFVELLKQARGEVG